MKRLLVFMLCLILALGTLFACSEEEQEKGNNKDNVGSTDSTSGGTDSTSPGGSSTDTSSSEGTGVTQPSQGKDPEDTPPIVDDDAELGKDDLKYQYNMADYITLPAYDKHTVELLLDNIQQVIDNEIMNSASKSRRTICMPGDVVNVTCIGYKADENGDILYDDTGRPVSFVDIDSTGIYIGSGLSFDEIERGIVGMAIGDIREVSLTLPKDYSNKEVAGKLVVFEVILNAIYDAPIYTDEFVKTNISGYNTIQEFESAIKKEQTLDSLYTYIIENAVVSSYPRSEYNQMAGELKNMEASFEAQNKIKLDDYLLERYGMTRDEYIKSEMKKEMVYYALAQAEKLTPTKEQLDNEREAQLTYYIEYYVAKGASETEAQLMAAQMVNDLGRGYIYENVVHEIVDKKLYTSTSVTEKAMTYKSITQVLVERVGMETGAEVGKLCPNLSLEAFDENGPLGTTIDISRNVGKLTVINLWGTWCPYCLIELPDFDKIASEYKDQLTIFAVHSTDGYSDASDYVLQNFRNSSIVFLKDYPMDPNNSSSLDACFKLLGGKRGYPYTVILDENGIIRYQHTGMLTYDQLLNALVEVGLIVEK